MAIAYASHSFTTPAAGEAVTITKPSGTVEGDTLIAHIAGKTAASIDPWVAPAGWTLLSESNILAHVVYLKTAGDSEPASYEFSRPGLEIIGGAIIRVTGGSTTTVLDSDPNQSNAGGSPLTFSGGVTPVANSLLLLLTAAYATGGNTMTISGQAIVTSNPTWTEAYDGGTILDVDLWMSAAYAVRPEATATGNYSVSIATTSGSTDGILLAIAPRVDATVNPAVLALALTLVAPTMAVTMLPAVLGLTLSVNAPTAVQETPDWTNATKTSASATNVTKNAASPVNVSKNSATFTNQSKS